MCHLCNECLSAYFSAPAPSLPLCHLNLPHSRPLPLPSPLPPVFGHDQWGHGLSGGFKGDVESLDYLINDLKQLIRAQRQVYRDVPFFILGTYLGVGVWNLIV